MIVVIENVLTMAPRHRALKGVWEVVKVDCNLHRN